MALRDALKDLGDAVKDLTSLHVQTYSGSVDIDYKDDEGFSSLRDKITSLNPNADGANAADGDGNGDGSGTGDGGAVSADVRLIAESVHKFDGDSYQFFADTASQQLRQAHNEAVKNGMDKRLALIEMFEDLLLE